MTLVSDRERERAATILRRQYEQGRLSVEQLSERLELALVAREHGDLRRAFGGLPPLWRDGDEVRRLARTTKRAVVLAVLAGLWLLVTLVTLVGFAAEAIGHGTTSGGALAFALIWLLTTILVWRARRRA